MYSTPPCPSLAASTAAYRRRSFSDSHPKNRCIFCSTSAVYTSMPHSLMRDLLCGKDTAAQAIQEVIVDHVLSLQLCWRNPGVLHMRKISQNVSTARSITKETFHVDRHQEPEP